MSTIELFADAISTRIADEWDGSHDFPEDAELMRDVLARLLRKHPDECRKLVGTGIIEKTYFDELT